MNVWSLVDGVLAEEEAGRAGKEKTSWWPSEALGCRRRSFYEWTLPGGTKKPMELTGLYRTKTGNLLHEWFFQQVKNSDYFDTIEEEARVFETDAGLKNPVSGRIDVLGKKGDRITAIDLKTTFGEGIRKIRMRREIPTHYLGQMMVYLKFGGVDEVILAFLGRDDQYRTQVTLTLREDVLYIDGTKTRLAVDSIIDKWKDVERSIEEETPPDRDFMAAIRNGEIVYKFQRKNVEYKSDWQCRYCPFNQLCYADELEKHKEGVNEEMFHA